MARSNITASVSASLATPSWWPWSILPLGNTEERKLLYEIPWALRVLEDLAEACIRGDLHEARQRTIKAYNLYRSTFSISKLAQVPYA
jgi:hypothetical protein